jgi:hypothetical protein
VAFLAFVVVYDGVFFYLLYRKLDAYRDAYVASGAQETYDDGDTLEGDEDAEYENSDGALAGYSETDDADASESSETADES